MDIKNCRQLSTVLTLNLDEFKNSFLQPNSPTIWREIKLKFSASITIENLKTHDTFGAHILTFATKKTHLITIPKRIVTLYVVLPLMWAALCLSYSIFIV